MLNVLKQCQKEIAKFSEDIRGEVADAAARLEEEQTLSLPLSRPMPIIGRGVHELRFRGRGGVYRVIYVLVESGNVWFLHAFQKKTEKTPRRNIEIARKRLREVL